MGWEDTIQDESKIQKKPTQQTQSWEDTIQSEEPSDEESLLAGIKAIGKGVLRTTRNVLGSAGEVMSAGQTTAFAGVGSLLGAEATEPTGFPESKYLPQKKVGAADIFKAAGIPNEPATFAPYNPALMPGEEEEIGTGIKARPSDIVQMFGDIPVGKLAKIPLKGIEKAGKLARILGAVVETKAGISGAKVVGEAAELGSKMPSRILKTAWNKVDNYFSPIKAQNADELIKIAESVPGLDVSTLPAAVKYGKNKSSANLERVLMEGGSSDDLIAAMENNIDVLNKEIKASTSGLSGGMIPDRMQAGKKIAETHDEAFTELMDVIGETNNSVLKKNPGMSLTKDSTEKADEVLGSMANEAERTMRLSASDTKKKEAKALLDSITAITNAKGADGLYNSEDFLFSVRSLGEDAFGLARKYDLPFDVEKGKKLYHELNNIRIDDIGKQLGPEVAKQIKDGNALMSDFFKKTEYIKKAARSGKSEEKIYQALIESGDLTTIKNLKDTMPEAMNQVRGTYLDSLIKRDGLGNIHYKSTLNSFKDAKDKLEIMFTPDELAKIKDMVRLGDAFGPMMNPGSAQTNSLRLALKDTVNEAAMRAKLDIIKERAGAAYGEKLSPSQRLMKNIASKSGISKMTEFATSETPNILRLKQPIGAGFQKISPKEEKKK